jgi:hypothetical protein
VQKTTLAEQPMLVVAGLVLVHPRWLQDGIGFLLFGSAALVQKFRGQVA